jgi:hypothetical protein
MPALQALAAFMGASSAQGRYVSVILLASRTNSAIMLTIPGFRLTPECDARLLSPYRGLINSPEQSI